MNLSPSRLSTFLDCGQKYKYKYVDHLDDGTGQAAVNGTFVHQVLEDLYQLESADRDLRTALGIASALYPTWAPDHDIMPNLDRCAELIRNYFDLEEPVFINCLRTEMDLLVEWGEHGLRGIIDRVDIEDDGYVIVDYKTGVAPRDEDLDEKALGIRFYAALGGEAFGTPPVRVRLLYLGTPQAITWDVTTGLLHATTSKINAGLQAISWATERQDFRASPSFKCSWCSFKEICPSAKKSVDKKKSKA